MPSNRRPALVAAALAAVLALAASACGPTDDNADDKPSASADQQGTDDVALPKDLDSRLKELGLDPDKWKHGEWKNWDHDKWLREAREFVNPIIDDLWKPKRMQEADTPDKTVEQDISGDQGVTDREPPPVRAQAVKTPYHSNAAPVGKVFFDSPEGPMVCSATVVKDPAHPGKSNMVWTAGHCVHAGKKGGWYRNIAFVPSYNDNGKTAAQAKGAGQQEMTPYGVWWADWAQTSPQWIRTGAATGGSGAPYDFSVLHVKPEKATGKSLEETVGAALPVEFNAPKAQEIKSMGAWGYPAAPPFDGERMYDCVDKPGRLSLDAAQPTMYRIGCTMTAGSSGGGWFANGADGKPALVSNTSIGPVTATWLAGPRLGDEAKTVYNSVSDKFTKK
ncbi:trypsin-like serine peptidase [Streptomyces sp. H27-D2]|uniref:trypsin-like serine peptidase n=1 Tax=Streptomyces sp. H27-D2 TaxID=3046304 RepID=UPI002DBA3738|nr:hypothetical protein [Streptomyces sp. H27-D2]MEC4015874.1 hypothetical protein [Streptomyces sp. H27-D2]